MSKKWRNHYSLQWNDVNE